MTVRLFGLIAIGALSITTAHADGFSTGPFLSFDAPRHHLSHAATEDPDLDRAMAWCDSHMHQTYNGSMGGNPMYGYDDARCQGVDDHWANSRSQIAAREAQAAAKKAADDAWFDQYVKSIGEAKK